LKLNGTGALLWSSLAEGATRRRLVALLSERFSLEADRAATDVDAFLADLSTRGLLRTGHSGPHPR